MPERSSKKMNTQDINVLAAHIVGEATKEKNPAAVALGRLGGLKGGKARASSLKTPQQRKEIAKKAAQARWNASGK